MRGLYISPPVHGQHYVAHRIWPGYIRWMTIQASLNEPEVIVSASSVPFKVRRNAYNFLNRSWRKGV